MTDKRDDALGATLPDTAATLPSARGISSPGASGSGVIASGMRVADYATLLPVDPEHYVRERELARGGMGRIIVARDRRLGREVAIKEVHDSDEELRVRFEREARITARLQHPSTIGLHEAGVWPNGEPFYAMTLVAGRPLDKVIAAAGSVEARFGLIANVLAVADALAYAHERKIVHRDLKPANVLVGEFGETVVIDWGLAKDLTVAGSEDSLRPSARSLGATGSGSGAATEHGAVIGTPAYMPPEQAEGNPVDERADVYALGALLYQVLAGAPPYIGPTSTAVLAEVLAAPPRPLAARVPEAPPDLITIVEKAMARDAANRFPTAKELAAELRKFQTGQLVGSHRYSLGQLVRRWTRKHRTTLAVAATALLALAVVGVISVRNVVQARAVAEQERGIAIQQRALAVQRDAEGRELVTFMLGDLKKKLEAVGKLDLLETVAFKVIEYYDRRGTDDSEHDRMQRASALMAIGDVLVSRGQNAQARVQFERARSIHEEVLKRDPRNVYAGFAVASSLDRLAVITVAEGNVKGAEVLERDVIRRLEALLANAPGHPEGTRLLLTANRALGDMLVDLGDGTGAAAAYRAAIAHAKASLMRSPNDPMWKRGLAINHSRLGELMMMQGDAEGALQEQRMDLALSQQLAAAQPDDTTAQNDVAGAHLKIGDYLMSTGDNEGALAAYRLALTTMKHLTALDPTNLDWAHDRAAAHDRVGNLLLDRKDTAGARAEYETARDLRQRVVASGPKHPERRNLGVSHNKLGNVFETEGKLDAALAEYELGRKLFETLASEDPQNAALQRDLSVSLYLTADALLALGRAPLALERHQRSFEIGAALAKKDPSNAIWQADVIDGHASVAKVLVALGKKADALANYRAALKLAEAAVAKDVANPQWTGYVKQMTQSIATCCKNMK